ncbi:MAG: DUF1929 domain-containing protein [Thaumarchaeota archaeon]|nr:DUF1929 domain-containing protein [Nitrososphaerota archaeon]
MQPAPVKGVAPTQASEAGLWEPVKFQFQHLPIHVALLRTGKILAFGGTGNDEKAAAPHPAELFDPKSGEVRTIDQKLEADLFCAGHSFLADGRLLVAGGTNKYDGGLFGYPFPPFTGTEQSYLFDPATELWTRAEDMANGRWYPTLVTLGDGRVLTTAGLTKGFPWVFLREVEVYSVGHGWHRLPGADRWLPLYPRLHLLPSGDVFYSGSYNTHYTFPFDLRGFPTATLNVGTGEWHDIGLPNKSEREEGTCVLLPLVPPDYRAKVLLAGGGDTGGKVPIPDSEVIDLSVPSPKWRQVDPMKNPRYYAYPVILPDKNILVIGGREGEKGMAGMDLPKGVEYGMGGSTSAVVPHDSMAVNDPELFDPKMEKWTTMATMKLDRLYHSNALLLPDGRVMTCGSNPARRVNELRIEIYHLPYMLKGPRPRILSVGGKASYGGTFEIETPDAESIQEVALIRSAATTHCVNTDQRYVGLTFSVRNPTALSAALPGNRNLAPPGFYMVFAVREGIPSEAAWVNLS